MPDKSSYTRSPLQSKLRRMRDRMEELPPEEKTVIHEFVGTMAMVQDEHHQEAHTHRKNMENEMGSLRMAVENSSTEIMAALNRRGLVATITNGCIKNWPYVLVGIVCAGGGLSEFLKFTTFFTGP